MEAKHGFGKFIIQAMRISYNHSIKIAYGTLSTEGVPGRGVKKLLARGGEDACGPSRPFRPPVQKLESDLREKLIDRSGKELLTDPGALFMTTRGGLKPVGRSGERAV